MGVNTSMGIESEFWSGIGDGTLSWEMGVLTGNERDETMGVG